MDVKKRRMGRAGATILVVRKYQESVGPFAGAINATRDENRKKLSRKAIFPSRVVRNSLLVLNGAKLCPTNLTVSCSSDSSCTSLR